MQALRQGVVRHAKQPVRPEELALSSIHTSTDTAPLRWSAALGCSAEEAGRPEGWMYTHVGV